MSDTKAEEADPNAETLARRLRAAREERRAADQAVSELGVETLRSLREAYRGLTGLLDQYEDSATGSGDFEAYMKCRTQVQEHVESLDDDLPERTRFEEIAERFDARRLSDRDFTWAREQLGPVEDLIARLDARAEAEQKRSDARRAVMDRLDAIEDRLEHVREVERLGAADLDAPVELLRDPVEAYNEAVETDFDTVRRSWPARDVLALVQTAEAYPLIDLRQPPSDLLTYVQDYEAGMEPLETLLEYADYSRSKLDHFVDEPMALKRHVATHRTYLSRLDATPFQVDWPPPRAEVLRFRARELVSMTDRFATEETVRALHDVRRTTRRDDYRDLRDAARARVELSADEREGLRSGDIAAERKRLEDQRDTLEAVLKSG